MDYTGPIRKAESGLRLDVGKQIKLQKFNMSEKKVVAALPLKNTAFTFTFIISDFARIAVLHQIRQCYTRNRTINFFFSCLSVTIHFLLVLFQALTIDPTNRAVQNQLRILKEKERKHDEHLSRTLGAMFGRKV